VQKVIDAVVAALKTARPARVLCLSTIGADATQNNLLTQRTMMEEALSTLSIPVTFLRPGWFLENSLWDAASARDEGVIRSFLTQADKPFAMVPPKILVASPQNSSSKPGRENGQWSWKGRHGSPQRFGESLRQHARSSSASRDRTARHMGAAFPGTGHEKPSAPNADTRRL
jgi:hypothetical protein